MESSLRFALGKLWEDCDLVKIVQTHFPNETHRSEPRGDIEVLKLLSEMFEKQYLKFASM